jgi:hypothetical protein
MSSPDRRPQEQVRLSEDAARLLLVRASELDATNARMLSVAQVREAAQEAGISPYAFDAALAELQQPAVATAPVPRDGFIPWRHRRKLRGAMFAVAATCLVVGGIFASRARIAPAPETVTSEVVVTHPEVMVEVRTDTIVLPRTGEFTVYTEAQQIHAKVVEQAAIDAARRAEEARQAAEALRRQAPR